jgi:hypothetical protein
MIAQPPRAAMSRDDYRPHLGDIMLAKQWRHIKLWLAGRQSNWDLAAYELGQLRASLVDAATLYSEIPVSEVAAMAKPMQSLQDAVETRNSTGFGKAFNELTVGCNACHRDMARAVIVIQIPGASPFSNQLFTPPKKK